MFKIKNVASIMLILAVVVTFIPTIDGQTFAASKKPSAPKITSAKVNKNTVTIKWEKAKSAKNYQVGIRSAKKKWVNVKTVNKNAKNKKKYTVKGKYKVKAKGKNYKVYQYKYTYTVKKKGLKKRTYKFSGLKYNTYYWLAVRSVNGKKFSAWKTVKRKTTKPSSADPSSTENADGEGYSDAYIASQPWKGEIEVPEDKKVTLTYAGYTIHLGMKWSNSVITALKSGATNGKYEVVKGRKYEFSRWKEDPVHGWTLWDRNGNHIEETKILDADVYMFDISDYDNFLTVYVIGGRISGWCSNMEILGQNGSQKFKRGDTSIPSNGYISFRNARPLLSGVPENGVLLGGFKNVSSSARRSIDQHQEIRVGFHFINAYRQLYGRQPVIYNKYLSGVNDDGQPIYYTGTFEIYGNTYTFKNQRFGAQAMAESMRASNVLTHDREELTAGPLAGITSSDETVLIEYASGLTVWPYSEACSGGNNASLREGEVFIEAYNPSPLHLSIILNSKNKYVGLGLSGSWTCEQFGQDY